MKLLHDTLSNSVTKEERIHSFMDCLFPKGHIDEMKQDGRARKSYLCEMLENCHFLPRKQSCLAFAGQFHAATMHHCSPEKLAKISADVKPGKILVITGDSDEVIPPHRSPELHGQLPGSELLIIKGGGHALPCQITEEFNSIMENVIQEGNQSFA